MLFRSDLCLHIVAIAHLDGSHTGEIDDLMRLQWIRHTPAQSRVGHLGKLAERQYHAALSLHHDIETTGEPDDENQAKQQPDAATAQSWLFETYSRMLQPPVEAHRNHQMQNARFICEGLSQMHALMRAEQRQNARDKLMDRHQTLVRLLQAS